MLPDDSFSEVGDCTPVVGISANDRSGGTVDSIVLLDNAAKSRPCALSYPFKMP